MDQLNIFDFIEKSSTPLKITKPVRMIELFAGYGSQSMALERLGVPFEHYRAIEFDAHAMKLYNSVHGTDFTVTDIRDISGHDLGIEAKDDYTYIMTYSFPCQDISVSGNMRGYDKNSGTRSSLLWEVERLLDTTMNLPDILLMENVSQVHGKGNEKNFQEWINYLSSKGYTSKWCDMNSKDYGVPQNRKRTFMISWLGSHDYEFPKPIELHTTMRDYLEDTVPEKYYINSDRAKQLVDKLIEDDKILKAASENGGGTSIDLTLQNPRQIDVANCISRRQDRGVSKRRAEGTGVVEYGDNKCT